MELDPDDIFRDDEDDSSSSSLQEKEANKEYVVYLVDSSPKMFATTFPGEDEKHQTYFQMVVSCISESLKTRIISSSYDEVAICFFNTREKKNLQDLNSVFVFSVAGRDDLDRPTAKLIKEFDTIEESFMKEIGSQHGVVSGSRDNSLYNALWVAQAILRKGSAKTSDKRILLFTNEDDPFGNIKGVTKLDMTRTTLQRAKDAQDLGISIDLLPLSSPDREFNMSLFYADMLGLEGDPLAEFVPLAAERLQDMKFQLRKRMFKKRRYRTYTLSILGGLSIQLSAYALIRPTVPGTITWLDSVTNVPLKTERSLICADTGSLLEERPKQFESYRDQDVTFSVEEIEEVKRVTAPQLVLLGFKPLSCLKDFHNLKPSTFLYPTDEEITGSTKIFSALHRAMVRLNSFAVAFFGRSSHPQLVALIAQDEITIASGQVEPPGMHMIYLPYAGDFRDLEYDDDPCGASDEQIQKARAVIKRLDLKDFSVCQFSNPALQNHYGVVQAMALEEDEMPEIKDETLPDEEGLARPAVVNTLEEFKQVVFGGNYREEEESDTSTASRKRKANADKAVEEAANYDWEDLADHGKLKDLTVTELKYYLSAHKLPLAGKKEALVSRILTHLGK